MLRLRRRLLGQAPSARGLAADRATCAQGPMVVVFFRARTMPGYVDAKTFLARDGERLTVIHWESAETLRAWAEDEEHRRAQAEGRTRWYEAYEVEVAEVVRRYGFERD